jgi:nucleoside-diphosphate-sugar epimerase
MRVLVTGHLGYIGSVLTPMLVRAGHDVVGLDADLYRGCTFGPGRDMEPVATIEKDLRDVSASDLAGFEAVVHLAALSNDVLGDIDPACTYSINLDASLRLAELAKRAGVSRFAFSSSCSIYGASGDELLDEGATFNPVTPYAESKVRVEAALSALACESFSPVSLRNATAFGYSPRLRLDLVVNEMVGMAVTTGEILIKSDGTPWRPLVHVEDISRAFGAVLDAPRESIHNEAFNIGATSENYRVSELAEIVRSAVPGSRVVYSSGGGPDKRCYRVDFAKVAAGLPGFVPHWTVERGVRQLVDSFRALRFHEADLAADRFVRIRRIRSLVEQGAIGADLRWTTALEPAAEAVPGARRATVR